ncbi:hypothetical protein TNCV_5015741 [Trichonephila clavipes]|nr:hypothetical protein TNCV_5015741 [Trichonephila clavipes]
MCANTITDAPQNRHECDAHRHGSENALSRNIQNVTDHCRLRNYRKIFLFISLKRKPGFEPGPLVLQSNALPLNYTHATANLCFAFRRNGYENAQKNISLHFPEDEGSRV